MAMDAIANGQSGATGLERLLACPYFALNPLMYIVHFPECCRGGWNISKLKTDHLYEKHYELYCKRCKKPFKSKAKFDEHMELDARCGPPPWNRIDRFGPAQYKEISSRAQPKGGRAMSLEDKSKAKWNKIVKTLFPHVHERFYPQSPFFDQKITFFRFQYGGALAKIWADHSQQEWERVINALMSIMFPGSLPVGAQYPASSMVSGNPTSSLYGDGDTASTSFNMAPLLPGEEDEEEAGTPTARSPVFEHLGGRFGNDRVPSGTVDPILRSSGAPANDDITGILHSSWDMLPPFRTGDNAFGIFQQSAEFPSGEHRLIESSPDMAMAEDDDA
ncbi:hypothetical protein MAPG_07807 [Magnaporthiopsis poae ATCC 64411]|uniref:C2H2-type domain-containing protein n=1 Tax=Magnaporthiopsis poae (strain ATCC 64411 / 73-15) TaxID=644358 RepID=A0A0C4E5N3_MAGP6|nr:hypothetical protein MAPG_07807 [Magnaporthiopsis poae ATCC 64411]